MKESEFKKLVWIAIGGLTTKEVLSALGFEESSGILTLDGKPVKDISGNQVSSSEEVMGIISSNSVDQRFGIITDVSQLEDE